MANAWALRPLTLPALSASSSASGYDVGNLANDYAGVVWKSAGGASSVVLSIDFGVATAIDAALFFGCTGASATWTLSVHSADNSGFTTNLTTHLNAGDFVAGTSFPTHGRGVGFWESAVAVTPRRYWRFTIGNLSGAQVTIARLAVGARLTLERNFAFGGGWGVRDLGRVDFSPTGVRVRRRAAKLRLLGLTFPAVTKDEVEAKVQPLIELVGGQEPIVLVTDPAPHGERQRRCWFGHLYGELGTVWRGATGWEWRANLVDLIPIPKGG